MSGPATRKEFGMFEPSIMYAHDDPDKETPFTHVYPDAFLVSMCGKAPVKPVTVRPIQDGDPPSSYWGWLKPGAKIPTMVQPHYQLLCLCFSSKSVMQMAAERGEGIPVNVHIEPAP